MYCDLVVSEKQEEKAQIGTDRQARNVQRAIA